MLQCSPASTSGCQTGGLVQHVLPIVVTLGDELDEVDAAPDSGVGFGLAKLPDRAAMRDLLYRSQDLGRKDRVVLDDLLVVRVHPALVFRPLWPKSCYPPA